MIKTKSQECWWKLGRNLFALPPPPILNRVQNELTDSCPVKTIKKEKYIIHCSIACSAEVTCIVTIIILENMFWNIKSAFFPYGGIGEEEICCWACMFANAQYQPLEDMYLFLYFSFLSGFSFTTIHGSQDCRGKGKASSQNLDISRAITAESSPLHISSSQTRTKNLWFSTKSC